jgi:hypothetical protein
MRSIFMVMLSAYVMPGCRRLTGYRRSAANRAASCYGAKGGTGESGVPIEQLPDAFNAFGNLVFIVVCKAQAQAMTQVASWRKIHAGLKAGAERRGVFPQFRCIHIRIELQPEEIAALRAVPPGPVADMSPEGLIHRFGLRPVTRTQVPQPMLLQAQVNGLANHQRSEMVQ